MKLLRVITLGLFISLLTGCAQFSSHSKVAPLPQYEPTLSLKKVWSTSSGNGTGGQYLRLTPVRVNNIIFSAAQNGVVSATDLATGKTYWHYTIGAPVTAALGAGAGLLFVGTSNGELVAMRQKDGAIMWRAPISSEVLAAPTYARGTVIVKSEDGRLVALSAQSGKKLWSYAKTPPSLILRGSSSPQVSGDSVVAGFADGDLVSLSFDSGKVLWKRSIAMPHGSSVIQRMVDIDGNPVIDDGVVYVATYRGKIAAVSLKTGHIIWQHKLSSYSGLSVGPHRVYVTDADSRVLAYDRRTGATLWQQKALKNRKLSGTALFDHSVIVGDAEGYLHLLSQVDGDFQGMAKVGKGAIIATPLVFKRWVILYTTGGALDLYSVS